MLPAHAGLGSASRSFVRRQASARICSSVPTAAGLRNGLRPLPHAADGHLSGDEHGGMNVCEQECTSATSCRGDGGERRFDVGSPCILWLMPT